MVKSITVVTVGTSTVPSRPTTSIIYVRTDRRLFGTDNDAAAKSRGRRIGRHRTAQCSSPLLLLLRTAVPPPLPIFPPPVLPPFASLIPHRCVATVVIVGAAVVGPFDLCTRKVELILGDAVISNHICNILRRN